MPPKFRGATGRVWALLQSRRDVAIADLFSTAYPMRPERESRVQQQRIGWIIKHINKNLGGQKIGPGVKRRTYRLRQL